jgi:hypothetical protein
MFSHGSVWNFVPLSIREQLLGDLPRDHGLSVALDGKTHHRPDELAMARFGIGPDTVPGRNLMNGGFEFIEPLRWPFRSGARTSLRYLSG